MNTIAADVGLIGLAVIGRNLALNLSDHDYTVAVYNRSAEVTAAFLAGPAQGRSIQGCNNLNALIAALKKPRCLLLLIRAGAAVDAVIQQLLPLLDADDIIIDLGNSHYADSERRCKELTAKRILFVGSGISGGAAGARHGASIMPGGADSAWPTIAPMLQAIAAKVDGQPCCQWLGGGGAGHYVKMVHNGIEYGDMQLIAEAYQLLHRGLGMSHDAMAAVFERWNDGELNSYLIQITGDILAFRDDQNQPLVEQVLDVAEQKGTGKWTATAGLSSGVPVSLTAAAVFARCLSAYKQQREHAATVLSGPSGRLSTDTTAFVSDLGQALYAAKIISYAQGFMLLQAASRQYRWDLNLSAIALLWRSGCIIRSRFLGDVGSAFEQAPDLNLLLSAVFSQALGQTQGGWRRIVAQATLAGLPIPALSSALSFYDSYRRPRLPTNLIQAQRDYFGAHTYERIDRPRGQFFHTDWSNQDG